MIRKLLAVVLVCLIAACNSSAVKDAIDLIEGVPRKDIDTTRLGTNAFVNDPRFGTISEQFLRIRDTLRLNFVRVLFEWNDGVQASPNASPNFSFYDQILDNVPAGMDVLVIVTGIPSWMSNSANWVENNPRTTFAERYARRIFQRYGNHPRVVGFQIWNEPNMSVNSQNVTLGFVNSPENYVEMLARSYSLAKSLAPSKLVLNAATTAINQDFPQTLDYNRGMRDAGAQSFVDRWAIHYYGRQFENVITSGGVQDFLNGLSKGIWVTESGAQGVNSQLEYGERVWPFLRDRIPGIERIYQYQFAEPTDPAVTYGLLNLSQNAPVSDLYIWLRDRP
jgi:hypothetical protein